MKKLFILFFLIGTGMACAAQTSISSSPVSTATVGEVYTSPITAVTSTNNPITITAVSSLPAFLSLSSSGQSQGQQVGGTVPNVGAVASDPANGNLYAVQNSGTDIYKITPDGTTTVFATKNTSLGLRTYGGAMVIGNFLYVSSYSGSTGGISKYDLTTTNPSPVTIYTGGGILSMTYNAGFIYAADYNGGKIIKLNLADNSASTLVTVPINGPFGLGFNSNNELYIAYYGARQIWKYSPGTTTGGTLTNTGLSFTSSPSDVKIDAQNNVYVSFSGGLKIRKYTPDLSSYTEVSGTTNYVWGMSLSPAGVLAYGDYSAGKVYKLQTGASITGTPATGDIGTYEITTRASDGTTSDDQTYTLSVYGPSTIGTFGAITKYANDDAFDLTDPGSNSSGAFTYTSSNTGVATISGKTVTITGAGTTTITATQAASGLYLETTKTLTLTVNKPLPTLSDFNAISKNYGDAAFTLSAPGSNSTGAFTYTSSNTAVATISGNTVTIVGAGTATLTATQAATGTYSAASIDATLNVAKASPTIGSFANIGKTYGDAAFTLSAPGSNSTGTFTYSSSNTAVATISGSTVTLVGAGTATITATQAATANYTSGTASSTLTVAKSSPTIGSFADVGKTYGDAAFTLSAPGSNSAGAFTYTSSNTAVATISGSTVTIVGAGTAMITATQDATANYTGGTASSTLTVAKASPTIGSFADVGKTYGDAAFALSAPGSNSAGTFTYSSSNTAVATISGGTVSLVGAGTATITATQAATANYLSGTASSTLTVAKASPTIGSFADVGKTYGDAAFTLSAPGSNSAGTFTYTSSNTAVATISGSTVTLVGAGTATITATQDATYNYTGGTASSTLTVAKASPTIGSFADVGKTYGDAAFALSAPGSNSAGAFTYSSSNTDVATISGSTVTLVRAGTATITATQAATANYTSGTASSTLTVAKSSPTIGSFANVGKTYGDAAFTLSAPGSNSTGAFTYTSSNTAVATISGSTVTIVGAGTAMITATQAATANYTSGTASSTLTVAKAPIHITADAKQKIYGEANPVLTFAYTGLVNNDTKVATEPSIGTTATSNSAVGSYPITLTGGSDANYVITLVNASLTVSKAIPVFGAFTGIEKKTTDDPFALTAPASNSTGSFTYTSSNTAVATITGNNVTITGAGITTITATQAATSNFQSASINSVLTVIVGDTDGDGVSDQQELLDGTDPNYPYSYKDSDGDGVPDAVELADGTDANNPTQFKDSNGNGLPDYYEAHNQAPTMLAVNKASVPENQSVATVVGLLSTTDVNRAEQFTYTLVEGEGSIDNKRFTIVGRELRTAEVFNYELKNSYTIRLRTTDAGGLTFEKNLIIEIDDVNEQPGLDDIPNISVCYTTATQKVALSGISAGPETQQSTALSVSSTNQALFSSLTVTQPADGHAEIRYVAANHASGTASISVTLTDNGGTANGGQNSITKTFALTVNALPVVSISADQLSPISKGATVKLTASGGSGLSYQWADANGIISGQHAAELMVRPTEHTTYTLTVTNASGCKSQSSYALDVNEDYAMVSLANIVTPNGDGMNDRLVIKNIDMYPNHELKVFDRAGRILYRSTSYQNDWDVTLNGAPLAEGTYYYVVDFGAPHPKMKGFFTVILEK